MNSYSETVAPMCLLILLTSLQVISQTFPVPPYLHTRNNQILKVTKPLPRQFFVRAGDEATKACEPRLSSVYTMCELCTEVFLESISSPLMCTDYLHAYSIPLDMLCFQTMCQPKLFLCAFLLLSLTVRGEVL